MIDRNALPTVHNTVVHMLQDALERRPDAIALKAGDGERAATELSYRDYASSIATLAHRLSDLGAAGERVALVMGNSIDMAIAMFAIHAAGAQAVPINPLYTAREVQYILTDAAPVATFHDTDVVELISPLQDTGTRIAGGGTDFIAAGENALPRPFPAADTLATLQYTGGTTGYPKGVNITHRQMSVNIAQREAILPTEADMEHIVCVMPLFHVFAVSMCLHLACSCRGRLMIMTRYHPAELCEIIEAERISILPAGPTIFNGLLNFDGFATTDVSTLRWCYSGSAPLPEETLKRWEDATGCFILEGYGQTEAGPVLTYNPAIGTKKPGSVGIPLAQTEVQVVDLETGATILPPGKTGEIRARGPQVMSGYRNLADETATTLRGGWLYTGDIGEFDDDGYLFIRDRKKDMAIVGGYNVFPREIDEVLYTHPAVAEAAAVGIPDDYYGEVIQAWVTLKPGVTCSTDDLMDYCTENLAKYKVPKNIFIGDDIPKTTVGKIDKKALRE
ncbi:MAG: long-chain acyl-CoA synthetase [Paracoccaceae bacterium]